MNILIWVLGVILFLYVGPMLFMGTLFIAYRFTEGCFPPQSMVWDRIFKPVSNLMWSLVFILKLVEHLCTVVRRTAVFKKYL
jgi:hypothetical protein